MTFTPYPEYDIRFGELTRNGRIDMKEFKPPKRMSELLTQLKSITVWTPEVDSLYNVDDGKPFNEYFAVMSGAGGIQLIEQIEEANRRVYVLRARERARSYVHGDMFRTIARDSTSHVYTAEHDDDGITITFTDSSGTTQTLKRLWANVTIDNYRLMFTDRTDSEKPMKYELLQRTIPPPPESLMAGD